MSLLVALPLPPVAAGQVLGVLPLMLRLPVAAAVSQVRLFVLRSVSASTPLLLLPL